MAASVNTARRRPVQASHPPDPPAPAGQGRDALASPFSDAFAVQSARLILQWLPKAYGRRVGRRGPDRDGGRGRHRRAGVRQRLRRGQPRLAHAVGARFHLAHGRANAIFLPTCSGSTPACR